MNHQAPITQHPSRLTLPGGALLLALLGGAWFFGSGLARPPEEKPLPKPLVSGLVNPASAAVGPDGALYITAEVPGKEEAAVFVVKDGKAEVLATGLSSPGGIVAGKEALFVADGDRVWRITTKGKADLLAHPTVFRVPSLRLVDIDIDENGILYATGTAEGKRGVIFRITPTGQAVLAADSVRKFPLMTVSITQPGGIKLDSENFAYVQDRGTGDLYLVRFADGLPTLVASGVAAGRGLTVDRNGRLYLADAKKGTVQVIGRPGQAPVTVAGGFGDLADLCLSGEGKAVLAVDRKAGTVTALPVGVPGEPVDESALPIEVKLAFPDLEWTGWSGSADGRIVPHRPLVLTHAGDGSDRVFVATQQGVIHVFPNDQKAKKTTIFLDIQDRVRYDDKTNEEGLLGLAFSSRYARNGEFYAFYTPKKEKGVNYVSRFRVSRDNANRAEPASEEVILRFEKPFWNHDGGTLCFGPDGCLYIIHGDGGAGNDPFGNGQNLGSLLGKVLRIDVENRRPGKGYAIPEDNPFTKVAGARPEIWAYGIRNIWRMSFDRKTGKLWAADVGQNLWEEIDLIERGGNYGWNLREGKHTFGPGGVPSRPSLIEPIWEYHHDVGKSITGGHVYWGNRVAALQGSYLYGDYITGALWALRYDAREGRVTANNAIRPAGFNVFSFGEDEKGEVYVLTSTASGQGIYWFAGK
jgi:glucose/arabinose dehydrogenase